MNYSTSTYHGPFFTDTTHTIQKKGLIMAWTPKHILAGIALIVAVISFAYPLPLQIPIILLSIAEFLP